MKKKFAAFFTTVVMVATLLTACGGDTGVSDETYNTLKTNWASMTSFYNETAAAYNEACSNGQIERDADFEELMNQAAAILEEMNNTPREDMTEEKAIEMNDNLIRLQEEMAESLGVNLVE